MRTHPNASNRIWTFTVSHLHFMNRKEIITWSSFSDRPVSPQLLLFALKKLLGNTPILPTANYLEMLTYQDLIILRILAKISISHAKKRKWHKTLPRKTRVTTWKHWKGHYPFQKLLVATSTKSSFHSKLKPEGKKYLVEAAKRSIRIGLP